MTCVTGVTVQSLISTYLPSTLQILAALDVHTSRWIVDKCLGGDLIKGRTVVMVVSMISRR